MGQKEREGEREKGERWVRGMEATNARFIGGGEEGEGGHEGKKAGRRRRREEKGTTMG